MLLKAFNRATQCPKLLVSDILSGAIFNPEDRLAAIEMLGFVEDTDLSMPVFEAQLRTNDSLHLESIMIALRTLFIRDGASKLSGAVKARLIEIAMHHHSPSIRQNVIEALADFQFY